tara:strand:+ start:258621 stop:259892 length:1272 start_codon:yes stop_codon:yes gene_type:complete
MEHLVDKEIVIVGAGPVGLWTAIQIKKREPNSNVKIYERYTEYKRSHVLKLEARSALLYAKNTHDDAEKTFFNDILGGGLKQAFKKAVGGKSVFIRTNELEKALKNYAHALGVTIEYSAIDSPEALIEKHPNCTQFIAADGAHSKLRGALIGDDAIKDSPLQYVAEVKYETQGATKALPFSEHYKTNKLLTSMAFEYVGKEKDGKTPVSLRLFIDEANYQAMPEASFKQPLKLNDDRLPPSLAQDIKTYMNVRKTNADENYIQGSEKLSKLTLSLYRAKKFAVQQDNRNWYLVGDAAMGVPYFRSLNAGMIIGSQLGYILTQDSWSDKTKQRSYNACRPLDIAWEFTAATLKNGALQAYDGLTQLSAKVPWEFMKWNKKDRAKFTKKNHQAFKNSAQQSEDDNVNDEGAAFKALPPKPPKNNI